jgi:hypothetical protein
MADLIDDEAMEASNGSDDQPSQTQTQTEPSLFATQGADNDIEDLSNDDNDDDADDADEEPRMQNLSFLIIISNL